MGGVGPDAADLGPDDPAELRRLPLDRLRAIRAAAREEEADLSYLRRMLQGRIDILRAELTRRRDGEPPAPPRDAAPEEDDLVGRLSEILRDAPPRVRGSARHLTVRAPRARRYRELVPVVMASELTDLGAHDDAELADARARLVGYEQQLSGRRHAVQRVADAASSEIARRYREGEASVDDLLEGAAG
ncbi:hypothetical protein BIV57_09550 [Mangrovactinospora gilvigrisea]|uniref:RsiG-like domain-containing protein n=1 Tax=Mangrovactinospora gilvigrisea TaxID=1428644 RepID=A0A1J7BGZ3_9ACTN|nr:hypothetical protein BIV57_09550 [Mangrovactinospora gilvigrisea]